MIIDRIELHLFTLPLVHPFQTSFGRKTERPVLLVSVHGDGLTGWGECVAHPRPDYNEETITTAWHVLGDFLIPPLIGQSLKEPRDVLETDGFRMVRGNRLARAALENAVWDLIGRARGQSLRDMLGGTKMKIEVGVSIGIQRKLDDLLSRVEQFRNDGYGRIKVKIQPGWDIEPIRAIRERFGAIPLMADANSAYRIEHCGLMQAMDEFELMMIEQPFAYDDLYEHSILQQQLQTPICLDESIHTTGDVRLALHIRAGRIINIKVGRVGGLSEAVTIHNLCAEAGIPAWCGGMLETGVGRAVNLHLASLPQFKLPSDISASSRYFTEDIAQPEFLLNADSSTIDVPQAPGIGVDVDIDRLARIRSRHEIWPR